MGNVSTLIYVLENLEEDEWIDLNEMYEQESEYLHPLLSLIEEKMPDVRTGVINNILQMTRLD